LLLRVKLTDQTPTASCVARVLGTPWRETCDAQGTVRFPQVWVGTRDVEVTATDPALEGLASRTVAVVVNVGEFSDYDVVLFRAGAAQGVVTGSSEAAVNALVTSEGAFAQSADSGLYLLQGVVPGERAVSAFFEGGVITLARVPIPEAAVATPVDFAFSDWSSGDGEVTGKIIAPGMRAESVRLSAFNTRSGARVSPSNLMGAAPTYTFFLSTAPGAYWFEASADVIVGGVTVPARVSRLVFVQPGVSSALELVLPTPDMIPAATAGDVDQDGILDGVDEAPFDERLGHSVDTDADGIPDAFDFAEAPKTMDSDGDGWADGADNCPNDSNPLQDPLACRECVNNGDCDGSEVCSGNSCVPPDGGLAQVAMGEAFTCALKDSKVFCFGKGLDGQLGTGAGSSSTETPLEVPGLPAVSHLAVGGAHACAIGEGASPKVFCWGRNSLSQCGTPVSSSQLVTAVALSGIPSAVAAGADHTCALLVTGRVVCWGANAAGQLGGGTTSPLAEPTTVEESPGVPLEGVTAISAGGNNTCAQDQGVVAYCWGDNSEGTVGNGGQGGGSVTRPVALPGHRIPRLGSGHACYADAGQGFCWGLGASYQLGNRSADPSPTPIPVQNLTGITEIAAVGQHTCAAAQGGVSCWGLNNDSQLGAANAGLDPGFGSVFVGAAAMPSGGNGSFHTCIISENAVYCAGRNNDRQSGPGTDGIENFTAVPGL